MHARIPKQSRRPRFEAPAVDGLVVAGLTELAVGALMFRSGLKEHPVYKAGVAGSFVSASWGFVGLAAVAWKRWLVQR